MHRYPTRFQARQAAKKPDHVVQEPVQNLVSLCSLCKKDTEFVKSRILLQDTLIGIGPRLKNAIEIFTYLAINPTILLHCVRFREVARSKIAELRSKLQDEKEMAVNTFIAHYERNLSEETIQRLEETRNILSDIKLLESQFKKVEQYV